MAVEAAKEAAKQWSHHALGGPGGHFQRAALLLAGPVSGHHQRRHHAGHRKNVFQAEIDAACELIDLISFNVGYMYDLYGEQPLFSSGENWNMLEYRPLEGFVFAATPFNFTAIAGNLPTAPAITGNTVVWKPASSAVYNAWHIMCVLKAAGLPDGVINFIPGPGSQVGPAVMSSPDLAGIHFTGSTPVFQKMWGPRRNQHRLVQDLSPGWWGRPGARTSSWCTNPRTWTRW